MQKWRYVSVTNSRPQCSAILHPFLPLLRVSYGALTPPDAQVPLVSQERSKYVKAMASSPSFAAIGFVTGAQVRIQPAIA